MDGFSNAVSVRESDACVDYEYPPNNFGSENCETKTCSHICEIMHIHDTHSHTRARATHMPSIEILISRLQLILGKVAMWQKANRARDSIFDDYFFENYSNVEFKPLLFIGVSSESNLPRIPSRLQFRALFVFCCGICAPKAKTINSTKKTTYLILAFLRFVTANV